MWRIMIPLLLAPLDGPDDMMARSLPRVEGEAVVVGLREPVSIERDARGIPVVRGGTYEDVVRAEGFLHGQERFVQMDLLRRRAAGELAALAGPLTLGSDRQMRPFRFRALARRILQEMDPSDRHLLEVYAGGVNAGLADLGAAPPEYLFIEAAPEPWVAEDVLLVMFAMFDVLHMNARFERGMAIAETALPEPLLEFLTPETGRFDAPLIPDERAGQPMPIPGPEVVDLRSSARACEPADLVDLAGGVPGSNNWAVAGTRSAHGGAMVANDPHLPLTVPNIWYRAQLEFAGRRLAGLTLPGVPGVLIGSNGHVTWGFTNTMGDFQDLVIIEVDPDDPSRYRTPEGFEPFEELIERIEVKGGEAVEMRLRRTRWGVVTDTDWQGRPRVLTWTALDPAMINMGILRMADAVTLEEAVQTARTWYGPSQNVLIADETGRIAWVVSGYLPNRVGFDGRAPRSWADGTRAWDGPLPEALRPVLIDPEGGILYTANNRTAPLRIARRIGRAWGPPIRAYRIRERLRGRESFDERGLLDIQLDTRSLIHDFYRDLLLQVVEPEDADARLREARAIVAQWDGTAGLRAVGFVVLDQFRRALHRDLLNPLVAPCREVDPHFRYFWLMEEEPVRRILEERPAHLLPPPATDWREFLRAALTESLDVIGRRWPGADLAGPWGRFNRPLISHPLAMASPRSAKMLNMPRQALPGHLDTVRVQGSSFGASARMVVSPGREATGLLHMPAGQSGHPRSPHYRDGHEAWVKGLPTPFLAGPMKSRVRLVPAG